MPVRPTWAGGGGGGGPTPWTTLTLDDVTVRDPNSCLSAAVTEAGGVFTLPWDTSATRDGFNDGVLLESTVAPPSGFAVEAIGDNGAATWILQTQIEITSVLGSQIVSMGLADRSGGVGFLPGGQFSTLTGWTPGGVDAANDFLGSFATGAAAVLTGLVLPAFDTDERYHFLSAASPTVAGDNCRTYASNGTLSPDATICGAVGVATSSPRSGDVELTFKYRFIQIGS